jgi:general secretion pathway protein L
MTALDTIRNAFWRWLDHVAEALIAIIARLTTKRTVFLVEKEHGHFALLPSDKSGTAGSRDVELAIENGNIAGSPSRQIAAALRGGRVELLLRPDRFVFKPIELPARAAEFLDGVVRAQIDRLTPWNADHAAFGFSRPAAAGAGRIVVTVAATAKDMLTPLLQAFTALGARSVTLGARAPEAAPDLPAITIMQENIGGILDIRLARRILLAVLAFAFLISATAGIAATIIDRGLQARQDALARRIAQRRAAALTARNNPGDPKTLAERALARRKNESPSAVIALEILSQILPDHTYVTELRIDADKLRVSGITHDAPGLIRLIEQTRHFSQAAFFAPVTRSSSDTGDRFNIEARMEPNFSPTP